MTANKYPGNCTGCGERVPAGDGVIERKPSYSYGRMKSKWIVWCMACYNKSDNSGHEDRQCGNRAYEDECARKCGL